MAYVLHYYGALQGFKLFHRRFPMLLSPQLDALSKIADIIAVHSQEQEMLVEILDVLETKLHLQRGTIMLLTTNTLELAVEAVRSTNRDHRFQCPIPPRRRRHGQSR